MTRGAYTRTGTRRSGDDYQDLVALEIMLDWLENPNAFQWMAVEADDVGSLDDVVALGVDGTLHSRQVKFSTSPNDPEDAWTWEILLEQKAGERKPKSSLLQKWAEGLKKARTQSQQCSAAVVSNRRSDNIIAGCLDSDGRVDVSQISAAVQTQIGNQIGGTDAVISMFQSLRFDLGKPSHSEYEERLKRRFIALGGTQQGWLQLKDELRGWVRQRNDPPPDGRIRLNHVKSAAGWRNPRPLLQEFEVPADYILPSRAFHTETMQILASNQIKCAVIHAPPGYGKSTYASYLFRELLGANIPVVRHHYFLSVNDRSGYERLGAKTASESLLHDITTNYEASLGVLATRNPEKLNLREVLDEVGSYYATRPHPLVIILDGLDHVWRERGSTEELVQLLSQILPVPTGIVVLLVSQTLPDTLVPPVLRRSAPRETWRELPPLDADATHRWLRPRKESLGLQNVAAQWVDEVFDAIFEKTQGHPLLLRYTCVALEGRNVFLTKDDVERLPGVVHGDIKSYYNSLIISLSPAASDALCLFAACKFSWPKQGLQHCLRQAGLSDGEARSALQEIAHLMVFDESGQHPFHSSLLAYITESNAYKEASVLWKKRILTWLKEAAPLHYKWAHEWLLEAELGNPTPLQEGPTREWTLEAIVSRQPRFEADQILGRGTWESLSPEHLRHAVRLGLLRDYFSRVYDHRPEIYRSLLPVQLFLDDSGVLREQLLGSLPALHEEELVSLADSESATNVQPSISRIFDEFLRRRAPRDAADYRRHMCRLTEVAALVAAPAMVSRVVNAAIKNRANNLSKAILGTYAGTLRRIGNVRRMKALLDSADALDADEWRTIFSEAVWLCLEEETELEPFLADPRSKMVPESVIYSKRKARILETVNPFPLPDTAGFDYNEVITGRGVSVRTITVEVLRIFIANHLIKSPATNTTWIAKLPHKWPPLFYSALNNAAADIAARLSRVESQEIETFLDYFSGLPSPEEVDPDHRFLESYAYKAFSALPNIVINTIIPLEPTTRRCVSDRCIKRVFGAMTGTLSHSWMEAAVAGLSVLSSEAVEEIFVRVEEQATTAQSFQERAEIYADLANYAHKLQQAKRARLLVRSAAENLLAHSDHKDMLLFAVMRMAESCHKAGVGQPWSWLLRSARAVCAVETFTDGDETRHLAVDLADAIAVISPSHLPTYHQWLCTEERWYDASRTLRSAIKAFNLSDKKMQLLAGTAIEEEDIRLLVSLEAEGSTGAGCVLNAQKTLFGPRIIDLPKESGSSSPTPTAPAALPQPSAYPPGNFRTYHAAIRSASFSLARNESIEAWLDWWASAGKIDAALQDVCEVASRQKWFGGTDTLYRHIRRHWGASEAFPWLCLANHDERGWTEYWGDKKEAEQRWSEVRAHYSDRWLEFLKKSLCGDTGEPWRELVFSTHQLSRVCEFLVFLGQKELAATMSEAAVDAILDLVPLVTPVPAWTNGNPSSNPALSLLVNRLSWPSGLVRERAASAIADLLCDPETHAETRSALLDWIASQRLQSLVAIGLLPLIRAKELGAVCPSRGELAKAVGSPSLLTCLLLRELGEDFLSVLDLSELHSGKIPDDFQLSDFFSEFIKNFLPPFYYERACDLEEHTGLSILNRWNFEWSQLLIELGIEPRAKGLSYWNRAADNHVVASDLPLAEVYRTSYLRTIAWALDQRQLDHSSALVLAAEACPIDLSLWRAMPRRRPPSWPAVKIKSEELDAGIASLWKVVGEWYETQKSLPAVLAYANGCLGDTGIPCELEIIGALRYSYGPNEPDEKELESVFRLASGGRFSTSPLRSEGCVPEVYAVPVTVGECIFFPLAVSLRSWVVPRWQWWRMKLGLWAPPAGLAPDVICSCRPTSVIFEHGNKIVAEWFDWTEVVRERNDIHVPPVCGVQLDITRDLVDKKAEVGGGTYCWVCKVILHMGERHSSKREAVTMYHLFSP